MQVIVARIHSGLEMPGISDGSGAIVFSDTLAKAPAGNFVGGRKSPSATVTSARQQSALLSRLPRSVCPCSQSRTAKNAKSFDRMRFSSLAVHATIRIANKTDVTALQAAIPTEGKHATVLATVQVKLLRAGRSAALDGCRARRRLQRWSGRRNGAAPDRSEEWQTGCTRNPRSIFPCPHGKYATDDSRRW
jgi:hypothetical protein